VNAPIIIALNKIDKGSRIIDVEQQLLNYDIVTESKGGDVPVIPISALVGTNIDQLIEEILLRAEFIKLESKIEGCRAEGYVIESRIDRGFGLTSSVLVKRGSFVPGK
jgi:translation initiation factor IF-2